MKKYFIFLFSTLLISCSSLESRQEIISHPHESISSSQIQDLTNQFQGSKENFYTVVDGKDFYVNWEQKMSFDEIRLFQEKNSHYAFIWEKWDEHSIIINGNVVLTSKDKISELFLNDDFSRFFYFMNTNDDFNKNDRKYGNENWELFSSKVDGTLVIDNNFDKYAIYRYSDVNFQEGWNFIFIDGKKYENISQLNISKNSSGNLEYSFIYSDNGKIFYKTHEWEKEIAEWKIYKNHFYKGNNEDDFAYISEENNQKFLVIFKNNIFKRTDWYDLIENFWISDDLEKYYFKTPNKIINHKKHFEIQGAFSVGNFMFSPDYENIFYENSFNVYKNNEDLWESVFFYKIKTNKEKNAGYFKVEWDHGSDTYINGEKIPAITQIDHTDNFEDIGIVRSYWNINFIFINGKKVGNHIQGEIDNFYIFSEENNKIGFFYTLNNEYLIINEEKIPFNINGQLSVIATSNQANTSTSVFTFWYISWATVNILFKDNIVEILTFKSDLEEKNIVYTKGEITKQDKESKEKEENSLEQEYYEKMEKDPMNLNIFAMKMSTSGWYSIFSYKDSDWKILNVNGKMSKYDDILAYRNIEKEGDEELIFEYISKNDWKYFYENTLDNKKELEWNIIFAWFNENFWKYFYIIKNENDYSVFDEQGKIWNFHIEKEINFENISEFKYDNKNLFLNEKVVNNGEEKSNPIFIKVK